MVEDGKELDLEERHLRPAPGDPARPAVPAEQPPARAIIPWEGGRERGTAVALALTIWRFVSAPGAAFAVTPAASGLGRPWSFALLVGAVLGTVSELLDALMVALLRYAGAGAEAPQLFQFSIAGRSLEWLPVSVLSVAGCVVGLVVGIPAFLLAYSVVLLGWSCLLHLSLGLTGSLRDSVAGFRGTLRAVLYSQSGLLAAPVPLVGDPTALVWSGTLQILGCARMHGCRRRRAVAAVLLPAVLLLAPLIWLLWAGRPT